MATACREMKDWDLVLAYGSARDEWVISLTEESADRQGALWNAMDLLRREVLRRMASKEEW